MENSGKQHKKVLSTSPLRFKLKKISVIINVNLLNFKYQLQLAQSKTLSILYNGIDFFNNSNLSQVEISSSNKEGKGQEEKAISVYIEKGKRYTTIRKISLYKILSYKF